MAEILFKVMFDSDLQIGNLSMTYMIGVFHLEIHVLQLKISVALFPFLFYPPVIPGVCFNSCISTSGVQKDF